MLNIKIKLGPRGEYRRGRIDAPKTYVDLTVKLEELFDITNEFSPVYTIKYTDDEGDLISIKSDADFAEALRFAREESAKNLLRLTLFKGKTAPRKNAMNALPEMLSSVMNNLGEQASQVPDFLTNAINQGLGALETNPQLREKAESFLKNGCVKIATPFICDGCDGAIEGDRYHCPECPDFDLCEQCYTREGVKEAHAHEFVKISLVDAVIETFKNGGGVDAFFRRGCPMKNNHCAQCDVCDGPIVGIRHKCIDCADYDQCNVCFTSESENSHPKEHKFYTIVDPSQRLIPEEVRKAHQDDNNSNNEKKPVRALYPEVVSTSAKDFVVMDEKKAEEFVFMDVKKAEVKVEEKKVEEVERKEPATAFEKNLETLEQMGFADRKLNIKVLVQNKNKLFPTIQKLLA